MKLKGTMLASGSRANGGLIAIGSALGGATFPRSQTRKTGEARRAGPPGKKRAGLV